MQGGSSHIASSGVSIEADRILYRDRYVRSERYIVFFLTNTSISQARSFNMGKDADTRYNFIEEIPHIFGEIDPAGPYKYAFGIAGPMLLTQSVAEMQDEIRLAFNAAEKYNVPVYFQLDDCNNYTTQFGSGALPKFYENPDWCEWVSFPVFSETWGGESNGRLPYYWFNWGRWMHASSFPCFQSEGLRNFVVRQMKEGVLNPLNERLDALRKAGKEYLFAGMAIGWETHIPDYSTGNTVLNINPSDLLVNVLANDRMQPWEAARYGYHSLSILDKASYDLETLYDVIHDYSELLARTAYDSGIPKEKIYSHMVGFMSARTDLRTTFAPPVRAAVNAYCTPGYTLSPVTCPYNLDTLVNEIRKADSDQDEFACAEGYDRGVNGSFAQADSYFDSMFGHGAALVTVFGWGIEAADSPFAVSHSPDSPFVQAAAKWLETPAS